MERRDFNKWLSNFKSTIYGYDYYVDFSKTYINIKKIKVELNIMNSLIGSKNVERDFDLLLYKYPEVISCIPILIGVRLRDIKNNFEILDDLEILSYDFLNGTNTPEEYKTFMRETGLFDLIANHLVNNLMDYVLGVEVGLDSNGRKNRGGRIMENLIENKLKEMKCEYTSQMKIPEIQKKYGLDLSALSNFGKTVKQFDFVVKTKDQVYGIEVNYYSGGGSKLNETARSYKMLTEESRNVKGFTFVWITDGKGWKTARNNLEETFDVLETLYCLDDIENGALEKLLY